MQFSLKDVYLGACSYCETPLSIMTYRVDEDEPLEFCSRQCAQHWHTNFRAWMAKNENKLSSHNTDGRA